MPCARGWRCGRRVHGHRGEPVPEHSLLDAAEGLLVGLELRDAAGPLDGVDLSSKMAEHAAELCTTDDGKAERADAATPRVAGDLVPPRRDGKLATARRLRVGRAVRARRVGRRVVLFRGSERRPVRSGREDRDRAATSSSPSRPSLRETGGGSSRPSSATRTTPSTCATWRHRSGWSRATPCRSSRAWRAACRSAARSTSCTSRRWSREALRSQQQASSRAAAAGPRSLGARNSSRAAATASRGRTPSARRRHHRDITGRRAELGRHAHSRTRCAPRSRRLRRRRCPAGRRSLLCSRGS